MAVYSFQQLKDLWIMYGGPPQVASIAAAIAMGESGGNTAATAHEPDGTVSRGLFQINSVHGSKSSYDVGTNVRAAIELYRSKGTFTDWTVFNKGIYKRYLPAGESSNPVTMSLIDDGSSGLTNVGLPNPLDALSSLKDLVELLTKVGDWLTRDNMIRITEIVGGLALTIVGIMVLSNSLIEETIVNSGVGQAVIKAL